MYVFIYYIYLFIFIIIIYIKNKGIWCCVYEWNVKVEIYKYTNGGWRK
jgi:hypothetical protein